MAKCPVCGKIGPETGVLCPKRCAYLVRESALEVDAKGLERYLGKLIGDRYAVVGYLGRGGMGVVYRARDIKGTGEVAVKVLINQKPGKRAIRRFLREAKVAARLRHPNIVSTYNFGRVDEGFFLTMELVEGQPLSRYWRRGIPFDALVAIALQTLSALGAAHAAGVIHRDLKPGNILIGRNDRGGLMVKVVDFGLARFLQPERDTLTRTGELVGTPRYMSPEQARGSRDIDVTTDLYALGVILYEFSTGKVLFDAEVPTAVAVKHITDPVPTMVPRDGWELPSGFEAVVRKLLAKDQKARYLNSVSTRQALTPFLNNNSAQTNELPVEPSQLQNTVEIPAQLMNEVKEARSDGQIRFEPPIVGRNPQLKKLWTLHRQAIDSGRGSVIFVSGEAGVGKTRLLESFKDRILEANEMEWCTGETPQQGGHGFGALKGALGDLFGLRGHNVEDTRKLIRDVLASWSSPNPTEVNRLTEMFRPTTQHKRILPGGFGNEDDDERARAEREQLFGDIERVLRRAASERPLLVCLEDLHWAGTATREFLEYLIPRLKSTPAPLMIVCTFRSDAPEMREWKEPTQRLTRYEPAIFHRMELSPLETRDARVLVKAMIKCTDRLLNNILGMTSGNPLHISQVLRFLQDSQMLFEEGGIWDLRPGKKVNEIVPPELADLMTARLSRMLSGQKMRQELTHIVHRCALIGRRVPYRLLHKLLEHEAQATPAIQALLNKLEEALDIFIAEGVLEEDADATEDILFFCHGLLRETLNQRLAHRRTTRSTHLAAAKAKESYHASNLDARAGEIAEHYEFARKWSRALEWYMRAARVARQSWDLRACEERYLRAQAIMENLPGVSPIFKRQIHEALGELCMNAGRYEEAAVYFDVAFEAAENAGESEAMAHLLFLRGNASREQGHLKASSNSYHECLAVSRALGIREGIGNALLGLSRLARTRGSLPEAHRFLTAAEEQFEKQQDSRALADCHRQRAFIFMHEGHWDAAKKHLKEALEINRKRQDRWGLAHVHRDLAELAVLQGRNDEGQINARKALDLFESIGARFGFARSVSTLADVHKAQGHFQASGDQYQRALAIYETMNSQEEIASTMFQLGVVALKLGRPREARSWFDKTQTRSTQDGLAFYEGMALAGMAWASADARDPRATRSYLQHAHRRLPRDAHFIPDLAEIYNACADCFDGNGERALAEACRRKSRMILQSLGR